MPFKGFIGRGDYPVHRITDGMRVVREESVPNAKIDYPQAGIGATTNHSEA